MDANAMNASHYLWLAQPDLGPVEMSFGNESIWAFPAVSAECFNNSTMR